MSGKSSKEPQSPQYKYRRMLARFLREEREREPALLREDCPDKEYQKQLETEYKRRSLDFRYLLRLMMRFRQFEKPLPSPHRLRRLLILLILARIEAVIGHKRFREETASDYARIHLSEGDEDYTKKVNEEFEKAWAKYGEEVQKYFQDVLFRAFEELTEEPAPPPPDPQPARRLPTLDSFPEQFRPLVVIVGGYYGKIRREPEHVYDLFKQSQSLVNLHYLLRLKLHPDTEVISEQLFLELKNRERASELLGNRHLLVVGGPLVNAVSRSLVLKKELIFNFAYRQDTYRWEKVYDLFIDSGLFNPSSVKALYRMLETPQDQIDVTSPRFTSTGVKRDDLEKIKEIVYDIRYRLMRNMRANNDDITEQFRPKELFSPLEPGLFSCDVDTGHERALISLGENPWARLLREDDPKHPKYALIAVAGTNFLSTALAIKALGSREDFLDRPLGGLLEIIESNSDGIRHVTESWYEWLTQPYQVKDVLTKVDAALESFAERPDAFTLFNSEAELENYRKVVQEYSESRDA